MGREDLNVDKDQPIDSVVGNLIETIARKGRGFTLSLAENGENNLKVSVIEQLQPRDEWMPPAAYRAHVLTDAPDFIEFAKKYGSPERSVIYVGTEKAQLVVDESKERGSREVITLTLPTSEDYNEWGHVIGKALEHKTLLTFLMEHEDNLANPSLLVALQTVRINSQVNYESDIKDDGKTLGMVFKTAAGEELKRFPKAFDVTLPILEADEADRNVWAKATIRLSVELPNSPTGKPTFTLFCPDMRTKFKERIRVEAQSIRDELEGWLVVEGNYATAPHELKR